jgi:hypothetical protein
MRGRFIGWRLRNLLLELRERAAQLCGQPGRRDRRDRRGRQGLNGDTSETGRRLQLSTALIFDGHR